MTNRPARFRAVGFSSNAGVSRSRIEDRPNDGCGNAEEPEMIDPVPVFRVLSFTLQFGLIAQQRNQRARKDRLWRFCDMTRVSDEKASSLN
jgi:hypothetical protein